MALFYYHDYASENSASVTFFFTLGKMCEKSSYLQLQTCIIYHLKANAMSKTILTRYGHLLSCFKNCNCLKFTTCVKIYRKTKVLHFLHPYLTVYNYYTNSGIQLSFGYLDITHDEQDNGMLYWCIMRSINDIYGT